MTNIFGSVALSVTTAISLYPPSATQTQASNKYVLNCNPSSDIDNMRNVKKTTRLPHFTIIVDPRTRTAFYPGIYSLFKLEQNNINEVAARLYDDGGVGFSYDAFIFYPLTGKFHQHTESSGDTVTSNTIDGTCKKFQIKQRDRFG